MSKHVAISPEEAADRLAIRELVEAYAHCADRRDAKGQMALFTADTHFVVYMNAKDLAPSRELHSREALAPVFADLNQYAATMYFVGQSTIFTLKGDRATGEAYCIAHHLTPDGEKRRLMVAYPAARPDTSCHRRCDRNGRRVRSPLSARRPGRRNCDGDRAEGIAHPS
jgi:SnoaL-like domain